MITFLFLKETNKQSDFASRRLLNLQQMQDKADVDSLTETIGIH